MPVAEFESATFPLLRECSKPTELHGQYIL